MRRRYWVAIIIAAALLIALVMAWTATPSNDRDWRTDQTALSAARIDGDIVYVTNVRNFTYLSEENYTAGYYDGTYDLTELQSVEYIVEPFSEFQGLSHTMLTFGFADGRHLVLSVEARKEKGERYAFVRGALRQYELIYIFGDELDLIKVRTNHRMHPVRMYPLNVTREQMRELLVEALRRANALQDNPEFYNSFTSTCTTNLIDHVNDVSPRRVRYGPRIMLPGYSDLALYKKGLLNTTLPLAEAKSYYSIEERARACGDCAEFSEAIRRWDATAMTGSG